MRAAWAGVVLLACAGSLACTERLPPALGVGHPVPPIAGVSPDGTPVDSQAWAGRTVLLNVSAPFHCQMLQPAASRLSEVLSHVPVGHFALPVISNVTAAPHPSPQEVPRLLVQPVAAAVRWEDSMQYAIAQGCDAVLEVGPGKVLSSLMRRISRQVRTLALDDLLGRETLGAI